MVRLFARGHVLVVLLVVSLVTGGVAAPVHAAPVGDEQEQDPVDWWDDLEPSTPEDDPVAPSPEEVESAPLIDDTPFEGVAEATTLPEAGSVEVTSGAKGVAREVPDAALELAAASSVTAGETVHIEVLNHAVSARAGVRGFAFRLLGEDGSALRGARALPATLSVDYSGFKDLYGANYAGRLRVVALPECAFLERVPSGCNRVGRPLPTRNEHAEQRLVVDIADLETV
jgi:hypothetical protein